MSVATTHVQIATPFIQPRDDIFLMNHQIAGLQWMLQREAITAPLCRGGILADDMGLGKTFTLIALLKNSPFPLWNTLLICPPVLLTAWVDELRACGIHVCQQITGLSSWDLPLVPGSVCITTYAKVARFSGLLRFQFQRVILDEGHLIRNGLRTKTGLAVHLLSKCAIARWIVSATPIQNSRAEWNHYCVFLRVLHHEDEDEDEDETVSFDIELQTTLLLRRTMDELRGDPSVSVPPTPTFIDHPLHITNYADATSADYSTASTDDSADAPTPIHLEAALFRCLCNQLNHALILQPEGSFLTLERYMRIQQFIVHPQIYIDAMRKKFPTATIPTWNSTSTKWDTFRRVLSDPLETTLHTGSIVFCNFSAEIVRVQQLAHELGFLSFTIAGGMLPSAVGRAIQLAKLAVATNTQPVLLIVQIVAGGAGLNLQFCSRILFLSSHWNPAVVHQAVGRAVRVGQLKSVLVHSFTIIDPLLLNLDALLHSAHREKITLAKSICTSLFHGFHLPTPACREESVNE